jgi:hypothetical protein
MKRIAIILVALLILPTLVQAYVSLAVTSSTTPSVIEPDDQANLIMTITNSGNDYARNVKLTIKPHSFITATTNFYDLQTIGPSSSVQIAVPIRVSTSATVGTTALPFTIDYSEGSSTGTITIQNSVSIMITKRALIEVVNVTYDKELIQPGDIIEMDMKLQNVGNGGIKNLVVSIGNINLPFVPINSGSVFIGNLDPREEANATFDLIINRDAETIAYNVPLNLTYYDEVGILHSDTKYVGLKVSGKPDFVVTVESTTNMFAGNNGEITLSIANRGIATAQFLTVDFISDLNILQKENYIGNLDPDDTGTVSLDVNLRNVRPGEYPVTVELVYKDPYNQEFSESRTLEFEVASQPFQIPFIYQIVILLIILGVLYWKRHSIIGFFKRK